MIEQIERLALAALERQLSAAEVKFDRLPECLRTLGHELSVSAAFDGLVEQGGQLIAPVELQIHLDGDSGEKFRVGVLGVGQTRSQALEAAIAEWHLLAALPVIAALGAEIPSRRPARHPQRLADWNLHAGRAGIRGAAPAALQSNGDFSRDLLAALHRAVSQWPDPEPNEMRSIFILAAIEANRADIQVARDGLLDAELTRSLSALDWPRGGEAYLYKQMFVLSGRGRETG